MVDVTKLTVDDIENVYSGRPGCMCGCRGEYKDSPRSKKIILNKILRSPNYQISDGVIYVQTETRMLAAYIDSSYIDEE